MTVQYCTVTGPLPLVPCNCTDRKSGYRCGRGLGIYHRTGTLHSLHSTLYSLHSTLYTLHSTLYTLHSTRYTLGHALSASHNLQYKISNAHCSAVQCSAVQCSAVQCSAVQCSAVQCSAVQCSAVQCSAIIVCELISMCIRHAVIGSISASSYQESITVAEVG